MPYGASTSWFEEAIGFERKSDPTALPLRQSVIGPLEMADAPALWSQNEARGTMRAVREHEGWEPLWLD